MIMNERIVAEFFRHSVQ